MTAIQLRTGAFLRLFNALRDGLLARLAALLVAFLLGVAVASSTFGALDPAAPGVPAPSPRAQIAPLAP